MADMQPQRGEYSISLPVTFDYRGGRSENKKNKIIMVIVTVVLSITLTILFFANEELMLWQKLIYSAVVLYVGLFVLRFFVGKELYYSDIYETLVENDFELSTDYIWQIFEIDYSYPYVCYFRNGKKGIFVRMERDAITGKSEDAMYDHYEAISDAYNIAHSLNMDIVHIDYMDNVGNDNRFKALYDSVVEIENVDMQDMMIDIYTHLQEEMSRNYSKFDVYLFLTRDSIENFTYNVQTVTNTMLGGNFITFKVLNRQEISGVCKALFNLHDFGVMDACETVLYSTQHSGITPIRLIHADGTEEKLGKTSAEKKLEAEERARKLREQQEEAKRQKREAKLKKKKGYVEKEPDHTELNLFEDDISDTEDFNSDSEDFNSDSKETSTGIDDSEDFNSMD